MGCILSDGSGIDLLLVDKLQALRDSFGAALTITSGCRCVAHNSAVGGALTSQHLGAMGCRAADLLVRYPSDRATVIGIALHLGLSVGVNKGFIHVDNRKEQILFLY